MSVEIVGDEKKFLQKPEILIEQEVDGHKLVFNSAANGGPVILLPDEERVFNFFKNGDGIHAAKQFFQGKMEEEEFNRSLLFLTEKEFLVGKDYPCEPDLDSIPNLRRTKKVTLMTTCDCNMIGGCRNGCHIEKGKFKMTFPVAKRIVDKVVEDTLVDGFGKIRFILFGGEPLLEFPMIKEVMEYARENYGELLEKKFIQFLLITNGLLIDKQKADFFADFGIDIGSSAGNLFSGNSDEKMVQKFLEAQKMLQESYRAHGHGGTLSMWVVVNKENLPFLPEITEKAISAKRRIKFSMMKFAQNATPFGEYELAEYIDQSIKQLSACFNIMESALQSKRRVSCGPTSLMNRFSGTNYMIDSINLVIPKGAVCGVGSDSFFVVGHNGQVHSCQLTLDKPLGKIEEGSSKLIKTNSAMMERKYYRVPGCSNCNLRFTCAGGCQITTLRMLGKHGSSPYCDVYKAILPKWIRLEALSSKRF